MGGVFHSLLFAFVITIGFSTLLFIPQKAFATNLGGISTAPTQRFQASSLGLTDGANVTTWSDDQGGNSAIGVSGKYPIYRAVTYTGVGPAIEYDGTGNNRLNLTVNWTGATSGLSIFVVRKNSSKTGMILSTASSIYLGTNGDSSLWYQFGGKQGGSVNDTGHTSVDYLSYNQTDGKFRAGRNNRIAEVAASGALSIPDTTLYIGGYTSGYSLPFKGWLYDIVIYTTPLSASDIAAIKNALSTQYHIDKSPLIVYDGDSITQETPLSYPPQAAPLLTKEYGPIINQAVGGTDIPGASGRLSTAITYVDPARLANIYVEVSGTNDLSQGAGSNPTTVAAAYRTLLQNARAQGFTKIVASTILPRSTGVDSEAAFETRRQAFNTIVRGWAGDGTYDALQDFGADPTMGVAGACDNLTLYQDGTHPTLVGAGYLAIIDAAAINSLDYTPPTPGTISFSNVTTTSITATTTGASDDIALAAQPFRYHNVTTGVYSAPTSTAITFTGLTPNTAYTFEVGVQDVAGNWATSTQQATTTLSNVTLPTLTVSAASPVSTSTATLNGNVTADGNASSTVHGFNYGTTIAYGSVASTTSSFGTGAFSQAITGLTPSTTYHFQAFATNSAGTGTSSDLTFVTSALPPPNISSIASSTTQTTATITWTTDQTASSTVNYGSNTSYGTASTSATLTTSHSITLSGLSAFTTYHFQVGGANSVGTISTSSDLTFKTTDTTPPSVTVTVPTTGTAVQGSSVTLTATSTDNVTIAGVQFKFDTNTLIGTEGATSPYSVTWDTTSGVADGAHTIIAVARDSAGNYATSTAINVTVDNTAPVRSVGAPSGTLALNTTNSTLSLTTNENATCKYSTSPGTAYGSMTSFTNTASTTHTTAISGLTNGGNYNYYVKCLDNYTNTNATDYTISFSIASDIAAPGVTMTAPTTGTTVHGSSVTLTATSTDDVAVVGVQFKLDNVTNIGAEGATSPYSVTWDTTAGVSDGPHSIVAVARDGNNNYATSTATNITVDNTAPVRSLGAPNGALSFGTTATTLSLTTGENATCKYSASSGTAYGSQTLFDTTGATTHSTAISGLTNSTSYTYYVKCQDDYTNTNLTDYGISFSVAEDTTPPVVTPTPTVSHPSGGSSVQSRVSNLISMGNPQAAEDLMKQYPSIYSNQSVQTTIAPVSSVSQTNTVKVSASSLTRNLSAGVSHSQVKSLQQYLNSKNFFISKTGAGSPGKETSYFGPATKAALIRFQKYVGIKPASGDFGPKTRAVISSIH